jgi:hypothetical protein
MTHLSELTAAALVVGSIFSALFGISFGCLYLGFTQYNQCPFQSLLPQGLVVFGLIGSICSTLALIFVSSFFLKAQ